MALRNLVTKMRAPAAAALRHLPPPAPSASLPPAGTRRLSTKLARDFEGSHPDDVRNLYLHKLSHYNYVMEQQESIRWRVKILDCVSKLLKVSFVVLVPFPLVSSILRVAESERKQNSVESEGKQISVE